MVKPDGSLDMKILIDYVNADPNAKQLFDDVTRPYLAKSAIGQILSRYFFGAKVIVIDSAVFFEDIIPGWIFNDIITVNCSPENQFRRLMGEMGCSEEVARNRMKAQIPLPFKCAMSTIVLDNNGKVEELDEQILDVIERWKKEKTPFYKWPDPVLLIVSLPLLLVLLYILI